MDSTLWTAESRAIDRANLHFRTLGNRREAAAVTAGQVLSTELEPKEKKEKKEKKGKDE